MMLTKFELEDGGIIEIDTRSQMSLAGASVANALGSAEQVADKVQATLGKWRSDKWHARSTKWRSRSLPSSSPRQPLFTSPSPELGDFNFHPSHLYRRCMYASAWKRHKDLIAQIQKQLRDMALDPRGFPGGGSPLVNGYPSTASAASLRARESEVVTMGRNTPDNAGGNLRVVVRVRGFLPRETERGAESLVRMDPVTQQTKLLAPKNHDPANKKAKSRKVIEEKNFFFDNSFCSFDENDPNYADQETVYGALGEEFLDHNFEGYHTCIFAYGQTGSGKSYTMNGPSKNPGIIPRTCQDLFERIESNDSPYVSYSVRISYCEIYNDNVHDLLAFPRPGPQKDRPHFRIREDPTEGPYVVGLTEMTVKNYDELIRNMRLGDRNRTTATTKMNDTSSRSHAVFTIVLKQLHHDVSTGSTTERKSRIRLVDLAGSERPKATEATGERLKEGGNINKSLATLARVIAALAKNSRGADTGTPRGKKKKAQPQEVTPFRESPLTWLLKESLSGNSKTAMIACIAPADYDETLSTLRYADQAKSIRTCAIVNQDSVTAAQRDAQIEDLQRQVRELQVQVSQEKERNAAKAEEKAKTRGAGSGMVYGLGGAGDGVRSDALEKYQQRVSQMQQVMEDEKLLAESKIRQMQEQNETLRLHLNLVIESIKNPIGRPPLATTLQELQEGTRNINRKVSDMDHDFKSRKRVSGVGSVTGSHDVHHGNGMNGVIDEADKENERPEPANVPEEPLQPGDGLGINTDDEHFEIQQDFEQLMQDVGLLRRKITDDKHRFGSFVAPKLNTLMERDDVDPVRNVRVLGENPAAANRQS